MDTLGKHDVKK